MTDTASQPEAAKKVYPVTWEAEDWLRINEAVRIWGEREHVNFTPADVIRSGTRRFVDDILADKTTESERRNTDRRKAS